MTPLMATSGRVVGVMVGACLLPLCMLRWYVHRTAVPFQASSTTPLSYRRKLLDIEIMSGDHHNSSYVTELHGDLVRRYQLHG
jgi:hypothetical protein